MRNCLQVAAVSEEILVKGEYRKLFFCAAICTALAACLVVMAPVMRSVLKEQRLKRFVKIETTYPGCQEIKNTNNTKHCECEFIFEDMTDASKISFSGVNLTHSYDDERRVFWIMGTGTVSSGKNVIQLLEDRIVINSITIPLDRPSAFHVLIKPDGALTNSRWDLHW